VAGQMFDFDFEDLCGSEAEEPLAQAVDPPAQVGEPPAQAAEAKLIGSWAYIGRHGHTVYSVRKAGSGHLLFEGPDAKGQVLSGVLQRQGRLFVAELLSQRGATVGSIKLALAEDGSRVVSNFRRQGCEDWGRDIAARRDVPSADPANHSQGLAWEDAFTVHHGFIRAGGDILVEEMTLAHAKARGSSMPGCRGFCFKGVPGVDAVLKIYFKDKWDFVVGPSDPGGWTTYRYEGAIRLSELPGAGVDEEIIAEVAKSRFESVYVFKSPLAAFPEWKKNLKVHQIVILWHPEAAALQLEYFVGGVHFQRKPHPWVHRGGAELVDQAWLPADFDGEGVAQVLRKWQYHGQGSGEAVNKDCVMFAMEVVEICGAMSPRLFAHFQQTLAQQFGGW